jgi:hypothetical protein
MSGGDRRGDLLRELMAVFDELPAPLRHAINTRPSRSTRRGWRSCAGGTAPAMCWR